MNTLSPQIMEMRDRENLTVYACNPGSMDPDSTHWICECKADSILKLRRKFEIAKLHAATAWTTLILVSLASHLWYAAVCFLVSLVCAIYIWRSE